MTKLEMKELEEWQHELHDQSFARIGKWGEPPVRSDSERRAERRAELLAKIINELREHEALPLWKR